MTNILHSQLSVIIYHDKNLRMQNAVILLYPILELKKDTSETDKSAQNLASNPSALALHTWLLQSDGLLLKLLVLVAYFLP